MFNPVALDAAVAAQIDELGTVRWLCTQGKAHGMFADEIRRRFPGSIALGTEGHLTHPGAAQLEFDGILGRHPLPAEFELIAVAGTMLEEVAVLHRPSATLILQDFVMPANGTWLTSLYSFAFGVTSEVGFPSYALMAWRSMGAFHASLRALRDSGFSRVAIGHGPAVLDEPEALRAVIDHTLALGSLDHKLMLARFFAGQPGFLADLVRYLRVAKQATGARIRAA